MKLELNSHVCKSNLCKDYLDSEKLIVAAKKGRKYELQNESNIIARFDIDDCVYKGHNIEGFKLCDNIIIIYNLNKEKDKVEKVYLWIELKGSDINHACKQILNSYLNAFNFNQSIKHFGRIVLTKTNSADFRNDAYKQLKKLFGQNLDHSNIIYKEKTSKLI